MCDVLTVSLIIDIVCLIHSSNTHSFIHHRAASLISHPTTPFLCPPRILIPHHVISRVDCVGPLRSIAKSPNNHLYAHRTPFHQLFDGLGTVPRIPLLLILPYRILETPPRKDSNEDLRHDVEIELFFFNDTVRSICINNLRQPYRRASEFNSALITVGVLNPSIFTQCLNYRALQTIPIWRNRQDAPPLPALRIDYDPAVLGLNSRSIRDFRLPVCLDYSILFFFLFIFLFSF